MDRESLLSRIRKSLEAFCMAAGEVQQAGFCCDSFTVLRLTTGDLGLRIVEVLRIDLELAIQLRDELQGLTIAENVKLFQIWNMGLIAGKILNILGVGDGPGEDLRPQIEEEKEAELEKVDEIIHRCSLAVQFLCLGFLSYIQAHCRAIQPFFLDTAQEKVFLQGSKKKPNCFPQISAQLVDLTCVGDMVQDSVFAFSISEEREIEASYSPGLKVDLFATPEDLIDTWGRGQFIAKISETGHVQFCGISIKGGIIKSTGPGTEKFHWSPIIAGYNTSFASTFSADTKLLIGTTVTVSENCRMDEAQLWLNSSECLETLGPFEEYWEAAERQAGIQVGQYVNLSYLQTWAKIPGNTLKQNQLALPDNHLLPFLKSSWGLQVSCCTSIARRVQLCELLADVMPAFVESLFPIPRLWEDLTERHNIIQAFRERDLQTWMGNLEEAHQQLVAIIIHYILSILAHTGVDRKSECFPVACIRKDRPFQCFKIRCQKESYWARILADSADCATFAYMTPKCLETVGFKCRDTTAQWRNQSVLLETAVCRHRPIEVDIGSNITPWVLQHEDCYSMGKLDSLQWIKVDRQSASSDPCLTVLPISISRTWLARLKRLQNLRRIRERQFMDAVAEDVVVQSHPRPA